MGVLRELDEALARWRDEWPDSGVRKGLDVVRTWVHERMPMKDGRQWFMYHCDNAACGMPQKSVSNVATIGKCRHCRVGRQLADAHAAAPVQVNPEPTPAPAIPPSMDLMQALRDGLPCSTCGAVNEPVEGGGLAKLHRADCPHASTIRNEGAAAEAATDMQNHLGRPVSVGTPELLATPATTGDQAPPPSPSDSAAEVSEPGREPGPGLCLEWVRRRVGDHCTLRRNHAGPHGHTPTPEAEAGVPVREGGEK